MNSFFRDDMSRFENWEGIHEMISIVIVQGCMNDLYPPRQVCAREGLVPSFGWIIILVNADKCLNLLGDMSGVGCWDWDEYGGEVGGGAIYMSGEWDVTEHFGGGVCSCVCGIMTWAVNVYYPKYLSRNGKDKIQTIFSITIQLLFLVFIMHLSFHHILL